MKQESRSRSMNKQQELQGKMPRHIVQWNPTINYEKSWYELYWDGPNSDFGSFRASPLPGCIAANKQQVMFLLRLAYQTRVKSFDEALDIVKDMRLRLVHVEHVKGEMKYSYPAAERW